MPCLLGEGERLDSERLAALRNPTEAGESRATPTAGSGTLSQPAGNNRVQTVRADLVWGSVVARSEEMTVSWEARPPRALGPTKLPLCAGDPSGFVQQE